MTNRIVEKRKTLEELELTPYNYLVRTRNMVNRIQDIARRNYGNSVKQTLDVSYLKTCGEFDSDFRILALNGAKIEYSVLDKNSIRLLHGNGRSEQVEFDHSLAHLVWKAMKFVFPGESEDTVNYDAVSPTPAF